MTSEKNASDALHELHILERNIQGIMMQKQALQLELAEIENALSELKTSKEEVYKVVGSVMIKSDRNKIIKELEEKKSILELRKNSVEKQEALIESKAESIKEEAKKSISPKK